MNFELNITIQASERLYDLVERILAKLDGTATVSIAEKPLRIPGVSAVMSVPCKDELKPLPSAEAMAQAAPTSLRDMTQDPDAVRAIMNEVRAQLFGADYEQSEKYQKAKRILNDKFRDTAKVCALSHQLPECKPTELPKFTHASFKAEFIGMRWDDEKGLVYELPF